MTDIPQDPIIIRYINRFCTLLCILNYDGDGYHAYILAVYCVWLEFCDMSKILHLFQV